jgi:lysyl-tRNA synthetase, class II
MADSTAASVEKATEAAANLHLDEVTGERVSKSELKKRQKQRQQEEKKREKAATAPPKTEKKTNAEQDEANLTPNVWHVSRDV